MDYENMPQFQSVKELEDYSIAELEHKATKLAGAILEGQKAINQSLEMIAKIKAGEYRKGKIIQ